MNAFFAAFWAESLKARRARITWLAAAGILMLPLAGGLFMMILKNPSQAQSWGLISAKAQLTVGVADWPSYFDMLFQGSAMGGAFLFALMTSWVFGREFSDHTAKEWIALPTPRSVIVCAKVLLLALWAALLAVLVIGVGLLVGWAVNIPGWTPELGGSAVRSILLTMALTFLLTPFTALAASWGRGYLPPMAWTILSVVLANILVLMGWGDWFPWSIPVMVSDMSGAGASAGLHSYVMIFLAFAVGLAATITWWQRADQVR